MRISQVIERLSEIQGTYGDITVFARIEDGDFEPISELEVIREDLKIREVEESDARDGHWEVLVW